MPRASEFDDDDQQDEDEYLDQLRSVMRDDVDGIEEEEEMGDEEGDNDVAHRKWGFVGSFDAVALKVCKNFT